jgi:hypothetical protein
MKHVLTRVAWIPALGVLSGAVCEERILTDRTDVPRPEPVEIELLRDPVVTFDDHSGKTTVVVQFVVRGEADRALSADDIDVDLLLDGAALDPESILAEGSQELSSDVYLGLVLDTSYSMLQHDPPAFAPMLTAARSTVMEGSRLWGQRPGSFAWDLSWFDEAICTPVAGAREWTAEDILSIPEPSPGTATKLFAAVRSAADRMRDVYADFANGPNDHHILVVFSDGADNYSWFDNSSLRQQRTTTTGATYEVAGALPTTLPDALDAVRAHPKLITYVIGLGSDVQDEQLQAMADAGGGRYFKNLASSEVGTLFDRVVREFTTIQTRGATIPLAPGRYTFEVRVWNADHTMNDRVVFEFDAGGDGTGRRTRADRGPARA